MANLSGAIIRQRIKRELYTKAQAYLLSLKLPFTRKNVEQAVKMMIMEIDPRRLSDFGGIVMETVESSHLTHVGYDMEKKILYVAFKNGSLYTYYSIDEYVYFSILEEPSAGKAFWRLVRREHNFQSKIKV